MASSPNRDEVYPVSGEVSVTAETRNNARIAGHKVANIHLRHLNPFARNLGEVLARYPKVLVPELNRGQLSRLLRAEFLTPTISLSKVQGQPFMAAEIMDKIIEVLEA